MNKNKIKNITDQAFEEGLISPKQYREVLAYISEHEKIEEALKAKSTEAEADKKWMKHDSCDLLKAVEEQNQYIESLNKSSLAILSELEKLEKEIDKTTEFMNFMGDIKVEFCDKILTVKELANSYYKKYDGITIYAKCISRDNKPNSVPHDKIECREENKKKACKCKNGGRCC